MQEQLKLKNTKDSFAREIVERSNKLYELEQRLGPELIDDIYEAKRSRTEGSFKQGTLGTAVLAAAASVGKNAKRHASRREFLEGICRGLGFGSAIGFIGVSPARASVGYALFYSYVENELIPQYPNKAEDIREYVSLKYPKIES